MEKLNYNEILVREPFYEVLPTGYKQHRTFLRGQNVYEPKDELKMRIFTQADFLRMYYPSGHKIMDPVLFPDIFKQDPDTKKWYRQPVQRTAFSFQQIITVKQVMHICGNDVQFELSGQVESEREELEKQRALIDLRQGWLDMNMEHFFYEAVESFKITGDCATVFYFDKKGRAKAMTLSYMNGDTLYPHFDSESGELTLFARKFNDIDEEGKVTTEYVEVWDEKYKYLAKRGISKNGVIQKIKDFFGLSGFTIVEQKGHGFNEVPVAYFRNRDGACFLPSQNTIETYEESMSYFCENNKAYAFPIMYSKGDGVEFKPDAITGAVKYVGMTDPDSDAGFLDKPDVSAAFNTQLNILYSMIYEQSFAVKPPELKSGDLPGVAIKLLFSPAIEMAMHDAERLQPYIEKLVHLVAFSYGHQENCQASLLSLPVNVWIEPYIHQNLSELEQNLATAVQAGFISKQTASERNTAYSKNGEYKRIMEEDLAKRKLDAQFELDKQKAQLETDIAKIRAQKAASSGQDINTGRRGRPRTVDTDENGNRPNENNWDRYDLTH